MRAGLIDEGSHVDATVMGTTALDGASHLSMWIREVEAHVSRARLLGQGNSVPAARVVRRLVVGGVAAATFLVASTSAAAQHAPGASESTLAAAFASRGTLTGDVAIPAQEIATKSRASGGRGKQRTPLPIAHEHKTTGPLRMPQIEPATPGAAADS
jgi:hypothetical protein